MKKNLFAAAIIAAVLVGCGSGDSSTTNTTPQSTPATTGATTASMVKCDACAKEMEASAAVEKGGKKYCEACAKMH